MIRNLFGWISIKYFILLFSIFALACNDSDDEGTPTPMVDADNDGVFVDSDCNDNDPNINPNAIEVCDGIDQDCDHDIDDGALISYYKDDDLDGYGSGSAYLYCTPPSGYYVTKGGDCLPNEFSSHPGAPDVCDSGVDNDCDGSIDEDGKNPYYQDADGDGFGNINNIIYGCSQPYGYVEDSSDCDDENSDINPKESESCDGVDNDCDNVVDNSKDYVWYKDLDNDSYGKASDFVYSCDKVDGYVADNTDCDDENATINPEADEVCDNLDNNCDDKVDEGFENPTYYYKDKDGDGYTTYSGEARCNDSLEGFYRIRGDCDDTNANIHPGADDADSDGIDQDCGGTSNSDPHVGYENSEYDSIQSAIDSAVSGASIWVAPGTYNEDSIYISDTDVVLISSHFQEETIIQSNSSGSSIFTLDSLLYTAVDGFTITGADSDKGGAFFVSSGSPIVKNCIIKDNNANYGAGFYIDNDSMLSIEDTVISNNGDSEAIGGAIYSLNSGARISNTIISSNFADEGGGLYLFGGYINISSSTFSYNESKSGAAIYSSDAKLTMSDSFVDSNLADKSGAGIYFLNSTGDINKSDILNNSAKTSGGGVYIKNSSPKFSNLKLDSNFAIYGAGVAIYDNSQPTFSAITISNNKKEGIIEGAGMYVSGSGANPNLQFVNISSNTAVRGAGIYIGNSASGTYSSSILSYNKAIGDSDEGGGGGIYIYNAKPVLNDLTQILYNSAYFGAGIAIFSTDGLVIDGIALSTNSIDEGGLGGGGVYIFDSDITIGASTFLANISSTKTGAFGGAILVDGASLLNVNKSLFSTNVADFGGAISVINDGEAIFENDSFTLNASTLGGGAIYTNYNGVLSIYNSMFTGNTTTENGGAIHGESSRIYLENSLFQNTNTAINYGGAFYLKNIEGSIKNSIFYDNTAKIAGAGYVDGSNGGKLSIENVVITANSALSVGGLYTTSASGVCSTNIKYSIFSSNTSTTDKNSYKDFYNDEASPCTVSASYSNFYSDSGISTNISTVENNNQSLDPLFYNANKSQYDFHLSLESPLVDVDSSSLDVDSSYIDMGVYGGKLGSSWDLDGDGYYNYFWPGDISDAPNGYDSSTYDCNDLSASIQDC